MHHCLLGGGMTNQKHCPLEVTNHKHCPLEVTDHKVMSLEVTNQKSMMYLDPLIGLPQWEVLLIGLPPKIGVDQSEGTNR